MSFLYSMKLVAVSRLATSSTSFIKGTCFNPLLKYTMFWAILHIPNDAVFYLFFETYAMVLHWNGIHINM